MGRQVQGLRSRKWQVQNRQGDVKDIIGNGVAKELMCMTHEHDQERRGLLEGMGYLAEEHKGGKIGTTLIA